MSDAETKALETIAGRIAEQARQEALGVTISESAQRILRDLKELGWSHGDTGLGNRRLGPLEHGRIDWSVMAGCLSEPEVVTDAEGVVIAQCPSAEMADILVELLNWAEEHYPWESEIVDPGAKE